MTAKDDKIIYEAKERLSRCQAWESSARTRFRDDVRFGNGDSVNNYQWPPDIANARVQGKKPIITVNRTRQHCLAILNDSRQNRAQIEIRPVGGGASFKSAEILESICRSIETRSNAQQAYDCASYGQIYGGLGFWRVTTQYADEDSFDQVIRIKRVPDPMSVYLDPNIQEYDGSDARYGFVYTDIDREQFDADYPKFKDIGHQSPLGESAQSGDDRIRLCEYFRKIEIDDKLHHLDNSETVRESDVKDAGLLDQLKLNSLRSRPITTTKIEHFLIAGDQIIERSDWPGKYIPLVRVIGEETVIDGQLDRKGHVRCLVSAQQCYNYYTSAGIEYVALQSKTPWIAPNAAIEEYSGEWERSNVENLAILPYNHIDDAGREIPAPRREQPPVFAAAYLDGTKLAAQEMETASGQPEATFGEPSNERSGKAVDARQRNAANSTFHFSDHLGIAIKYTGKILIDLIPQIYDTDRIIKILAQDGTQSTVQIDPNAAQAHTPVPPLDPETLDAQAISAIFNPQIGEYNVVAEIGPSYTTRREETFNAISQMIMADSAIAPIVGDLLFRNSDFVGADEIADRLKRMVPPQALGRAPDPQVMQLQQQLAAQHQVMQQMSQELQAVKSKTLLTDMQRDIEIYKSETERMKAIGNIDPMAMRPIIRQLVSEVLGMPANPIVHAHAVEDAITQSATQQITQPPPPGPPQGAPTPLA